MAKIAVREPVREPVHDAVRAAPRLRPGEAIGRDGQVIRRRAKNGDVFDVPEQLHEAGWDYQWCGFTIYGEQDSSLSVMQANGWTFVPPNSKVGMFFAYPGDDRDYIERGGLVLMERPQELTDEANEENRRMTALQYDTLMGRSSDLQVPAGFDHVGKKVQREREAVPAELIAKTPVAPGIPDED